MPHAVVQIPPRLFFSMDETFVHYMPSGSGRTYELKGKKNIPILGASDKRGLTLTVTTDAAGNILPFQCIYGGKTSRCGCSMLVLCLCSGY